MISSRKLCCPAPFYLSPLGSLPVGHMATLYKYRIIINLQHRRIYWHAVSVTAKRCYQSLDCWLIRRITWCRLDWNRVTQHVQGVHSREGLSSGKKKRIEMHSRWNFIEMMDSPSNLRRWSVIQWMCTAVSLIGKLGWITSRTYLGIIDSQLNFPYLQWTDVAALTRTK